MTYSNWTRMLQASVLTEVDDELRRAIEPLLRQLVKTVILFLRTEVSPTSSVQFEETRVPGTGYITIDVLGRFG